MGAHGVVCARPLQLHVNTFFFLLVGELELARLGNLDGLDRLAAAANSRVLNFLDNVVALDDFAEDDVLAIEPRGDNGGDEELS